MQPDRQAPMHFAYADPPYYGMCKFYNHTHGDDGQCWDELETHQRLIERLQTEYPDGWALSLASVNLRDILPLCPPDSRIACWTKPFASFKPGVNPGYTWEPVVFRGGRRRTDRTEFTVRDHLAESITLRRGLTGAKPTLFARWVLDLLGFRDDVDTVDDLFVGTGPVARALATPTLFSGVSS